jgi:hypothetical protein
MASAYQANTIFLLSFNSIILLSNTIQSYHRREIRVITMPKSEEITITHSKLIVLLPEKTPGKVGRKSKWSRTDAVSTPSTVSLLSTLTPKSNLSTASSKSFTLNGSFCNTVRTLDMDNICTAPRSQLKISSKVKSQCIL